MLECRFLLDVPIDSIQTGENLFFEVATLNFDPGLQVGSEIAFKDVSINKLRDGNTGKRIAIDKLNFNAIVLKRNFLIESVHKNDNSIDVFILIIIIEIAEKEQLESIVCDLISRYPDDYKRRLGY